MVYHSDVQQETSVNLESIAAKSEDIKILTTIIHPFIAALSELQSYAITLPTSCTRPRCRGLIKDPRSVGGKEYTPSG